MPVGPALIGEMIDAVLIRITGYQVEDGAGQVAGQCGATPLIRHDTDLFPFTEKTDHGMDEIVPLLAIEPGRSQYKIGHQRCLDMLFAFILAGTIHTSGIWWICFQIGTFLVAVKDIVRRDMDELRFFLCRDRSDIADPIAVDLKGQFPLVFRLVYRCVGRTVYDPL